MKIKHGLGTWITAGASILALAPPLIKQIVATIENVSTHWSGGEEISLISGAVVAIALAGTKAAQAVAAILKGSTDV